MNKDRLKYNISIISPMNKDFCVKMTKSYYFDEAIDIAEIIKVPLDLDKYLVEIRQEDPPPIATSGE